MAEADIYEDQEEVTVPLYSIILYWDAEDGKVKCDVGKGINAFEAYAWLAQVLEAMKATMPNVDLIWRWGEGVEREEG